MKIAFLGGTSFVGRSIISALLLQGHEVMVFSRQPDLISRWFPPVKSIYNDFCENNNTEFWTSHLHAVDIIINSVGVFHTRDQKEMWKIHVDTPKIIYAVADKLSIKIIHLSALGIDKVKTPYAESKLEIENYLNNVKTDTLILRPSFVYGSGSYGGSSFFRGLCGLPGFIPIPGSGEQKLQPVYVDDVCRVIIENLAFTGKQQFDVVGDEVLSLKQVLQKMRAWLGFGKAITISIPIVLLKIGAKFGDFFRNSFISSTGMKLLTIDTITTPDKYKKLCSHISFKPRSFSDGLLKMTSQVQDRWHARLFFLQPALRLSIAFVWIFTGIVTLFLYPPAKSLALLSSPFLVYSAATVDLVLGVATLMNYKIKWVGFLQCVLILGYTLFITLKLPYFWFDPFGPISKNIPLLVATAIMMGLESSR